MRHLNSDLLCVVTGFLTGRDYLKDDIVQVCIVPLDKKLNISSTVPLFEAKMRPRRNGIDSNYLRSTKINEYNTIIKQAVDPFTVADLFDNWFELNKLKDNKQLVALAYDWPLLSSFLKDWLGCETFNDYFSREYRDLMPTSLYCNDRAYWHNEDYPYPKQKLSYMASQLKIDYSARYDIMLEAKATAEIYKKMMSEYVSL